MTYASGNTTRRRRGLKPVAVAIVSAGLLALSAGPAAADTGGALSALGLLTNMVQTSRIDTPTKNELLGQLATANHRLHAHYPVHTCSTMHHFSYTVEHYTGTHGITYALASAILSDASDVEANIPCN